MQKYELNHTPGPWKVERNHIVWSTHKPFGMNGIITNCNAAARSGDENDANTRLIAAAPDLLTTAIEALKNIPSSGLDWSWSKEAADSFNALQAAIDKATGKEVGHE